MSSAPVAKEHRLPTNITPTHYELTVCTDRESLKFYGSVVIQLSVVKECSSIVFNSLGLELFNPTITSLVSAEPRVYPPSTLQLDKASERAILTLPSSLPAGATVELSLGFEAELTDQLNGYYRSSWKDGGKTKYYALTHFEPTAARRAFPCWDEPAFKATFSLTMIAREGTVNLANMPPVFEGRLTNTSVPVLWLKEKLADIVKEDDKLWKVTQFERTPLMSTYIVAYANGEFEYLESSYTSPLSGKTRPLRTYATRDLIDHMAFALEVKSKVIPLYEKAFEIEYPLPKLDTLVAHDFDAGAMENWGLIIGRTHVLTFDPKSPSLRTKKMVASIMNHEVAHMWFGNITTMQWWDYLYLNEDKIYPEWKSHSTFVAQHLANALQDDASPSSHPVEVPCPNADMINQIFDGLSYSKGASILRMLYNYAGEEKFMRGVALYLKEHLYGNSVTEDLWRGIQSATGIDIPGFMDNWVKKIGFPVVTVTETEGGINVRQDRFLETGRPAAEDNETIWTIPLFLLTVADDGKSKIDSQLILDEREKFIPLDTSRAYKLNAGTVGVYRVLYPKDRLAKIADEAAKPDSFLSLEDRMGFLMDSLAMAKAGLMDTSDVLILVDALRNEKEAVVWSAITSSLTEIISVWGEDTKVQSLLAQFTRGLYRPLMERLGFESIEGESADDRQLRTSCINTLSNVDDPVVVKELRERFDKFLATGEIDAEIERSICKMGVKHGGRKEFDAMWKTVKEETTPSLVMSGLGAMGMTQDQSTVDEIFDTIVLETRDQDVDFFFSTFAMVNFRFRTYVAKKFLEHYDEYEKRFEGNWTLQFIIKLAFFALSSFEMRVEIEEFFKSRDTSKFQMTLDQALTGITARAAWVERSTTDIVTWLEAKVGQQ
ncbi:leucyl aminopeptidase [Cristinia sonorae]|uniref:Aminopeptidase n=1 Tax=Cristinia sonorae TaxID=1940300 RepID=A0A8K0USF0_9AGAR|nr:leucyl aminopeptidase [Cristinia sonorae]